MHLQLVFKYHRWSKLWYMQVVEYYTAMEKGKLYLYVHTEVAMLGKMGQALEYEQSSSSRH